MAANKQKKMIAGRKVATLVASLSASISVPPALGSTSELVHAMNDRAALPAVHFDQPEQPAEVLRKTDLRLSNSLSTWLAAEPVKVSDLFSVDTEALPVAPKPTVAIVADASKNSQIQVQVIAEPVESVGEGIKVSVVPATTAAVAPLLTAPQVAQQQAATSGLSLDSDPGLVAAQVMAELAAAKSTLDLGPTTQKLTLKAAPGGLKFEPRSVNIAKVGDQVPVEIAKQLSNVAVFVRDHQHVLWTATDQTLRAVSPGTTELYVVNAGKMHIIPIVVGGPEDPWDLDVPPALVSLDSVFNRGANRGQASIVDPAQGNTKDAVNKSRELAQEGLALTEETTIVTEPNRELAYENVTIQVVDERTDSNPDSLVYPVGGAVVGISGTQFQAKSDNVGHVNLSDLPRDGRFFITIQDPNGQVRDAVRQVDLRQVKDGFGRIRTMRAYAFDMFTQAARTVQDASLGSICGRVLGLEYTPLADVEVSLDYDADGPYYFNEFSLIDMGQQATGPNGRFCFFNVPVGPVTVALYQGEGLLSTTITGVHAGRHMEIDLQPELTADVRVRLAMMPTAHAQLGSDDALANDLQSVEMIDLFSLGHDAPLAQLDSGLAFQEGTAQSGRSLLLAQASEFEQVLYDVPAAGVANQDPIIPLIPRGYIDDMAVYAQTVHDPLKGVVYGEYSRQVGEDDAIVDLHLVDANGQSVGDGWIYSDEPTLKALFFNVPPGQYALIAETRAGYWLDAQTVFVYSETLSYLRLGSRVQMRP